MSTWTLCDKFTWLHLLFVFIITIDNILNASSMNNLSKSSLHCVNFMLFVFILFHWSIFIQNTNYAATYNILINVDILILTTETMTYLEWGGTVRIYSSGTEWMQKQEINPIVDYCLSTGPQKFQWLALNLASF